MSPLRMNKLLKISIAVVIILAAGIIFIGNQRMTAVAQDTARLRAQVRVNEDIISAYTRTKIRVESLDYVDELANKVLPADQEQSAIIAEVSEFALRSSLSIEQITFADTGTTTAPVKGKLAIPKGVQVIPITVQFSAGSQYADVLEFLATVESNQRKMQVTDITLKPDADDRNLLSQVSVSMNLYAKQETKEEDK